MSLTQISQPPSAPLQDQGPYHLVMVGTHHLTASLEVRERLAFDIAYLEEALRHLRRFAREGFVLSTCNRVEVYGLFDSYAHGELMLRRYLEECHHVPPQALAPHLRTRRGPDAARHLFRVAAGLDSMVLGEDQIVSQLKLALRLAQQCGASGPFVRRLGHAALAAGKLVRSRTEIGRNHLSVVSVGLDLARRMSGALETRRVLVVGAGRIATLVLKHLDHAAPESVLVANRTFERAERLSHLFGAQAWPFERLDEALQVADVVISCTSSENTVIETELVARVTPFRRAPLLLLDLAVPRDVEGSVRQLPGVQLLDIDDLQDVCDANRATRAGEVAEAEALIDQALTRFMKWWASQRVVPTIKALRARAEEIRCRELERTLSRLPELSVEQQVAIQALTASIVNKLLHQPIVTIKDPADGEHLAEAAQQLFRLSVPPGEMHVNESRAQRSARPERADGDGPLRSHVGESRAADVARSIRPIPVPEI